MACGLLPEAGALHPKSHVVGIMVCNDRSQHLDTLQGALSNPGDGDLSLWRFCSRRPSSLGEFPCNAVSQSFTSWGLVGNKGI